MKRCQSPLLFFSFSVPLANCHLVFKLRQSRWRLLPAVVLPRFKIKLTATILAASEWAVNRTNGSLKKKSKVGGDQKQSEEQNKCLSNRMYARASSVKSKYLVRCWRVQTSGGLKMYSELRATATCCDSPRSFLPLERSTRELGEVVERSYCNESTRDAEKPFQESQRTSTVGATAAASSRRNNENDIEKVRKSLWQVCVKPSRIF